MASKNYTQKKSPRSVTSLEGGATGAARPGEKLPAAGDPKAGLDHNRGADRSVDTEDLAGQRPAIAPLLAGGSVGVAQALRLVLPTRRVPLYLGVAALLVVGVVDAPVAVAGGLVYEALRRWSAPTTA